jgi:hypothetical protein
LGLSPAAEFDFGIYIRLVWILRFTDGTLYTILLYSATVLACGTLPAILERYHFAACLLCLPATCTLFGCLLIYAVVL